MAHNPYAPPQSKVEGAELPGVQAESRSRPVLVWIIFIFYCLALLGAATTVSLIASSRFPLGNELQRHYFASLTWFDHSLSLAAGLVGWWAAFQLFRLRRAALKLFILSLGLGVIAFVYQAAMNPYWTEAMQQGLGWIGVTIGWILRLLLLGYVWRLARKGVLA
jgi:hypothetical protein